jgi:hypothetical protein
MKQEKEAREAEVKAANEQLEREKELEILRQKEIEIAQQYQLEYELEQKQLRVRSTRSSTRQDQVSNIDNEISMS